MTSQQNDRISLFTFTLPDIGEGVFEGEVIEWLKQVGDPVKKDEPVVVVMTDKATVELPSPYAGIIDKHYFMAGEIAIKDKPLFDVRLAESIRSNPSSSPTKEPILLQTPELPIKKTCTSIAKCEKSQKQQDGQRSLALPKVRKMAKELGIDIDMLKASGSHGEVTLSDIATYLRNNNSSKEKHTSHIVSLEGDESRPLVGIQGLMARKMDKGHIPQFSYFEEVDATRLIQLKNNLKPIAEKEGIHLSFMPFFFKALSLVIKEYPLLNSSIDMEKGVIILHKKINIGTAIASPLGLIVPPLKGVEEMGLKEIAQGFHTLKVRAKERQLTNADMHGTTITLSNFGAVGSARFATPMVSVGEAAILAVAKIVKAPAIVSNAIAIRDILYLSWSFDHRIFDGEMAANVSASFCKLILNPASLI